MRYQGPLKILSLLLLALASTVVILGAYTRLADAGLGCPDWPTCYGHLWVPNSADEIQQANANFADTPVETDKTWPEQIHRIFASTLGLIILITFALFNARRAKSTNTKQINAISSMLILLVLGMVFLITMIALSTAHVVLTTEIVLALMILFYFVVIARSTRNETAESRGFILASVLSGLVILQGLFGMWTVTLKLWPQVVTTHLLGGFATLSLIVLLCKQCWSQGTQIFVPKKLITAGYFVLALVVMQIALGGWMSSNYAALACPDFPLCQNALVPPMDFTSGFNFFQSVGPNYLYGKLDNHARTAIHYTHRMGAIAASCAVLFFAFLLLKEKVAPLKKYAAAIIAILVVQIGLGISNIVFSLPIAVAVLHNAGGAALLITLLLAISTIKKRA